jgi:ribosomal protein S18 acetylase RimI-like enzyme
MAGVLDMAEKLCLAANQVHTPAKQITRRSHLSDLLAVDPIVLHLPAMDGFHVQGVAEHEGNPKLGAEVCDSVPDEHILDRHGEILAVGFDSAFERRWIGAQILVHQQTRRVWPIDTKANDGYR